jgi:hypothetical protein
MNRHIPVIALVCSLAACSLAARPPDDLIARGLYRLETDVVDGCGIDQVAVTAESGALRLTGRVTAAHHTDWPVSVTGEAEAVAPDGRVVARAPLTFTSAAHARHIHPPASFTATFSDPPPVGSTIRISHRLAPYDSDSGLPRVR